MTDSKKLSKSRRELLDALIREHCVYSIAEISCEDIDQINILQATFRAMEISAHDMPIAPDFIYVDGNKLPAHLPCPAEAVVKGDSKIKEIGCASIIAKVYRDKIMADLAVEYPHYGWDTNAGYGSKHHLDAITKHGITPHHRKSFAPIKFMDFD